MTNRHLEHAINSALAGGRVDDAPYAVAAYLRRCVRGRPGVWPSEILVANGLVPSPDGETWSTAIFVLADLWSRKVREQREAKQRAPPLVPVA